MKVLKTPRAVAVALVAAGLFAATPVVRLARATATPRQLTPLQQAAKQVQDADAAVRVAQQQFQRARARVEQQFKARPDWTQTQQALDKAKADETAAKNAATRTLNARADYKAVKAAKEAAEQKMRALQESGGDPDQIATVGQQVIDKGLAMKKMEADALAAEPKYADARTRLAEAQTQMAALQAEVDAAAKADPDCLAAEQAVVSAQEQAKTARESLAQTRKSEADARAAEAKARAEEAKGRNSNR